MNRSAQQNPDRPDEFPVPQPTETPPLQPDRIDIPEPTETPPLQPEPPAEYPPEFPASDGADLS
ncbi:MAG: hypothetical protein V7676_11125 [Parasphingorhabdus sp.]|uniref:hypothetical protein n=1 Tax=Parasphingorhabdus sp. TaxID=2709688 RepID=UPI00300302CE